MRRRTTPTVLPVSITLTVQPMLAQNSTMTAVPGIRVGHFTLSKRLAVTLSVVPANPRARQLYERIGFQVIDVSEPFIRVRYQRAGGPTTT